MSPPSTPTSPNRSTPSTPNRMSPSPRKIYRSKSTTAGAPKSTMLMFLWLMFLATGTLFVILFGVLVHTSTVELSINQEKTQQMFGWEPSQKRLAVSEASPRVATMDRRVIAATTAATLLRSVSVEKIPPATVSPTLRPIDLSINFLSPIPWDDNLRLPMPTASIKATSSFPTEEDFLPVVSMEEPPLFRFRLQPQPGAPTESIQDITAYRIRIWNAQQPSSVSAPPLWDTGKVSASTMPLSIPYTGNPDLLHEGSIYTWMVDVWDATQQGPFPALQASKFAVGPTEWKARWIVLPSDYDTLVGKIRRILNYITPEDRKELCDGFYKRRPLPLAKATIPAIGKDKVLHSALLVVSGLGSFSVTINGNSLSSSSVMDPPLTDFTQRVSFRGYDITRYLQKQSADTVLGITLSSGWWDDLPLSPNIVNPDLMPSGIVTTIAQLHVTFEDGSSDIWIPTNGMTVEQHNATNATMTTSQSSSFAWQMAKGYIEESNLFTGEAINMETLWNNLDWDSSKSTTMSGPNKLNWTDPMVYTTITTREEWHEKLQKGAYHPRMIEISSQISPIGKLRPLQMPPVLPIARIEPVSVTDKGDGRWVFDFGKSFSGVVRFESGLPQPMRPYNNLPRGHTANTTYKGYDDYITVVHTETLEMETGEINTAVVAGFGYHNGGIRENNGDRLKSAGPCLPQDANYGSSLLQRDVYLMPRDGSTERGQQPVQSRFTFHGMRFAEVCCSKQAPKNVFGIQYRTKFQDWGNFDSSNTTLNSAYEIVKNSFDSNTIGIQSDCPHREKLQYGGDISANSVSALHYYDMSAFYNKIIEDWTESQWDNGAYTVTSVFMNLLDDRSIVKRGTGETVWAALAPVLTTRHMHHYGDIRLLERTLPHHVKWVDLLDTYWDDDIEFLYPGYHNYTGGGLGLGDWLTLTTTDNWLTHYGHYLASVRAVIYTSSMLQRFKNPTGIGGNLLTVGKEKATRRGVQLEREMQKVYRNGIFSYHKGGSLEGLGQNYGIFARVAHGRERCAILQSWLRSAGSDDVRQWPGDEERQFNTHLDPDLREEQINNEFLHTASKNSTSYRMRHGITNGILDIKYTFKTLADMGFNDLALEKASSQQFPGYGYMASFNATTTWETWWRSEDMFSRNHPMFGAISEWLVSAVAGVSLADKTVGGQDLMFWPRIPKDSSVLEYASAEQGTKRGDAAVAWRFFQTVGNVTNVQLRLLVPPSTNATLQLDAAARIVKIQHSKIIPDIVAARTKARKLCKERRASSKYGFPFFYHYDRFKEEWTKIRQPQKTGTACSSFLWDLEEDSTNKKLEWSRYEWRPTNRHMPQQSLQSGLFDIVIEDWPLGPVAPLHTYNNFDTDKIGPYCSDESQFVWEEDDAVHLV